MIHKLQYAILLQQKLTEVRHPDHTLITYPELGHLFYPSSQWLTATGPIEPKVLEDLFGWRIQSETLRNLPFCDKNEMVVLVGQVGPEGFVLNPVKS